MKNKLYLVPIHTHGLILRSRIKANDESIQKTKIKKAWKVRNRETRQDVGMLLDTEWGKVGTNMKCYMVTCWYAGADNKYLKKIISDYNEIN